MLLVAADLWSRAGWQWKWQELSLSPCQSGLPAAGQQPEQVERRDSSHTNMPQSSTKPPVLVGRLEAASSSTGFRFCYKTNWGRWNSPMILALISVQWTPTLWVLSLICSIQNNIQIIFPPGSRCLWLTTIKGFKHTHTHTHTSIEWKCSLYRWKHTQRKNVGCDQENKKAEGK